MNVTDLIDATGLTRPKASELLPHMLDAWRRGNITTPANKAMFVAQCGHESNFSAKAESLNYSPDGLLNTFQRYFDVETARKYGRRPDKPANQPEIARIVYGGRMGNNTTTDGWTYRGHGWLQHTGKGAFADLSEWSGFDYVSNPELLLENKHAAIGAAWYWSKFNLSAPSERRDVLTVSRIINCGPSAPASAIPHGLKDREDRFARAYAVLSRKALPL